MWPAPSTRYLNVHSSRRPIGPRAWSFCVELPISAPIPNSPPSVNRVEALTYTQAASTPSWKARADRVSRGDDRLGMAAAVSVDVSDRLLGRVDDADRELEREVLGVPVLIARGVDRHVAGRGPSALVAVQRRRRPRCRASKVPGQERGRHVGVHEQRLGRVADARPLQLGVEHDRLGVLEVGARVDVDVAVARRRVDHRHRRDALERVLQPLAAARDDQIDDAGLGRELGRAPRARRPRPATAILGQAGATAAARPRRSPAPRSNARPSSIRAARSRCPTSGTARRRRS